MSLPGLASAPNFEITGTGARLSITSILKETGNEQSEYPSLMTKSIV